MKPILPLFCAIFCAFSIFAQHNAAQTSFARVTHTINADKSDNIATIAYNSEIFSIPDQLVIDTAPFISLAIILTNETESIENLDVITVFIGKTKETLQPQVVKVSSDVTQSPQRRVFGPVLIPVTTKFWQIQTAISASQKSEYAAIRLDSDFFVPEKSQNKTVQSIIAETRGINGGNNIAQPSYVSRVGWNCPDGIKPSCGKEVTYDITTHILVHHSAGNTVSDSYGAVVLSYWNFHTKTNGWCDIAYNWLIDPKGVIYEGRGGGNNVRGAHFCAKNTNTMGICMIGDFQNNEPSAAALSSLQRLVAWKTCDASLNPVGTSPHSAANNAILNVISGHRDGCDTDCPGDNMYKNLVNIRQNVKKTKDAACLLAAVSDQTEKFEFAISPNPASQQCDITWDAPDREPALLRIFTINGQPIANYPTQNNAGKQSFSLSVNNFPKGMYLVVYKSKNYFMRKKLIVR
jgi:hypothetical protein